MEVATRHRLAAGIRAAVPAPARERARLSLASLMERRLRRSSAVRAASIVFHAVAERPGDRERELDPPVAAQRLDAAISYLAERYELVHAAELPAAARSRTPGEPVPVAVTFDDDLKSHRELAAPIIKRHSATATAFLCGEGPAFWWQLLQTAIDDRVILADALPNLSSSLVGPALARRPGAIGSLARAIEGMAPTAQDLVQAALAKAVPKVPPRLGTHDAAALASAGWELGSHTTRHYLLTGLDDNALEAALARRPTVPAGALPQTLAYPHGKATAREAGAARRAGYVAAFTGHASVLTDETDDHLIGRLQPDTATRGRFALELARALSSD